MAAWVFESIPEEERPELTPAFQTLRQANGAALSHCGTVWLPITLPNGFTRKERVFVADIEEECILGWTFLKKNGAQLDFANNLLIIDTESEVNVTNDFPRVNRISTHVPDHMTDIFQRSSSCIPAEYHGRLADLLTDYADVFSTNDFDIGRTSAIQHKIETKPGCQPIKQAPYRVPETVRKEIESQVQQLLEQGLIEPSSAPWASPVVMVKKKDGSLRLCVDYRRLNAATIKDAHPINRIDDTLDALEGAQYFSTLDLATGYWQVPLDEDAKDKSTFCIRGGIFRWTVMPFGVTNGPATFTRLMETVMRGLHYKILLTYLDDVIVYSDSIDRQLDRLKTCFERLRQAHLKLKPRKCDLFQTTVQYLGHTVTSEGVGTDPSKIEKVKNFPVPQNLKQVRSFVGLASYYRRFIESFADIAYPLHQLMQKNARFRWTEKCDLSFEQLKTCLTTAPILAFPRAVGTYILDTDASAYGIGGVLQQQQDGIERVIAYGSRSLSKEEKQYCTTRRELLAIVYFLAHFRHYLYGQEIIVRTDHGSLSWLLNFKQPTGQLARWLEQIAEYDIQIVYRPGRRHNNADTMSRLPNCNQCGRETCQSIRVCTTTLHPVWTLDDLREAQSQDTALQKLYVCKSSGAERPDWSEISGLSRATKYYWGLWDQLQLQDGVLCKRWEADDGSLVKWLVVVPDKYVDTVLHELHTATTGGHQGVNKTLATVKNRFVWYGMTADIRSWVRQCDKCSMRKQPHRKPHAKLQQFQPGEPMQIVAMDILGPLPESADGNKYILVIGEYFTKWVEAFAIPDQESETIARCFVDQFVCRFSIPHQLHSDQGPNFEAEIIAETCKLLGVDKTRTTPYHPSSDGFVERFNRSMMEMVSKMIEPDRRQMDWDEKLQLALFAYRSTPHTSTGESPNMLILGREANMPIDILMERPLPDEHDNLHTDYARELRNNLVMAYERARKHLKQSAIRQKSHFDKKANGTKIKTGQFVWLSKKVTKRGMSPKLDTRWEGPYLVVKQLSDVVFRIQRSGPRGQQKVVHYDRLKPYEGKPLSSWLHKKKPREVQEEPPVLKLQDKSQTQVSVDSTAPNQTAMQASLNAGQPGPRAAGSSTPHDQPTVQASVDHGVPVRPATRVPTDVTRCQPPANQVTHNNQARRKCYPKRQNRLPPVRYR